MRLAPESGAGRFCADGMTKGRLTGAGRARTINLMQFAARRNRAHRMGSTSTTTHILILRLKRLRALSLLGWTLAGLVSIVLNVAQYGTEMEAANRLGSDAQIAYVIASRDHLLIVLGGETILWLMGLAAILTATRRLRHELDERLRAETALRDVESRFRTLFEQSPASIVITDLKGNIEYVNSKFTRVTGYTADEVLGQNPRLLKSGELPPEEYRRMWATISAGGEWHGEFHNRKKNGELYWESASISAIRNAAGVITQYLAVKEDITEQKRTQQAEAEQRQLAEALRDTAAKLNSTLEFDAVLDQILINVGRVVPHDGANIMLISGETAYVCLSRGYDSQPARDRVLMVRLPTTLPHLQNMIETGAPLIIPDVTQQPNWLSVGLTDWTRSHLSAPIRIKGEAVGFINLDSATPGFFNETHAGRLVIFANEAATAVENARLYQQAQTELAERRKIEVQLQQAKDAAEAASQAKSIFLANMSHELRTPLNAILGFAQLMQREPSLNADQRDNLKIILQSGQHLLTLINDVLDMSKIESGRVSVRAEDFDLWRLLSDLEEMFGLRAADKGLMLTFAIAPDLPHYVYADSGKLRQVLINLLGNAVKFTAQGGVMLRANLRTTADEPRLLIEVEDTGPGLTPEELNLIFEPFVQTASGQKSQEGTGLGLTISRQFVQLMGGELLVNSTPGLGSTFSFSIPIKPVAGSTAPALPPRRVVGLEPGQPEYRLLVVDDREASRKLLVKLLTPLGFAVREAANGQEAIDVWQSWQPHLIWMDMRMPIMDGHEATQRIRATTQGQATVIIALTASAFQEERDLIMSEGCDDFLRKPFHEEEIFERLARHLGVKFRYSADEATDAIALQPPLEQLSIGGALPGSWLTELEQATIAADLDRMVATIEEIRPHDGALADRLIDWARNFNYEQILQFTRQVGVSAS